jgi:hypothetical protein
MKPNSRQVRRGWRIRRRQSCALGPGFPEHDGTLMMNTGTVKLIDQSRNVLAVARVALEDDHYAGSIDLTCTPPSLKALFTEFEEIVDGQMFSFLDEIQEKIGVVPIIAVFDNGEEGIVNDLQVFPSAGDVSFQCTSIPAFSIRPV